MNTQPLSYSGLIESVEEKILAGGKILRSEAEDLLNVPNEYLLRLFAAADRVRIHFKGWQFDSCSLINARSGRCGENCAFCAQSGHYNTDCETYGLASSEQILDAARSSKSAGAARFLHGHEWRRSL